MNDKPQSKIDDESDSTLSALLNLAGPTAEIPDQLEQRVYASVRSEWTQSTSRQRVMRWAVPAALAATVLIAISMNTSNVDVPSLPVGTVVANGNGVFVGDVIDTGSGGISLVLDGDISLRVDSNTILAVDSARSFTLMAGQIYVDTGDRIYADRHITIVTQSGKATDIGTQFSVRYENADMSVAVREGQVDLSDNRQTYSAVRGEKVTIRPGQEVQIESVPIAGPEWEWAIALAPGFELDGHSLLDFLKWVSRETGMELVFDSDEVRAAARRSRSYGSIEGLTPLEAVEAVLATTQFDYSIDGDTIHIR